MKVTLNIENDNELRAYIKDCIKGQVLNVVREEFLDIVHIEIERKIKGTNLNSFNAMLTESMVKAIRDILREDFKIKKYDISFIYPFVEQRLDKVFEGKNFDDIVDKLAEDKIKSLLKKN